MALTAARALHAAVCLANDGNGGGDRRGTERASGGLLAALPMTSDLPTEYTIVADVALVKGLNGSGYSAGVTFQQTDGMQFYHFRLDHGAKASSQLLRWPDKNSAVAPPAKHETEVKGGQAYRLRVTVSGEKIIGYVDSVLLTGNEPQRQLFLPKRIHTKEEDMKAIIFDLDGTLWSSVDLMLEVWKSGFSKIQLPHVPLTREIVCSCMGLSTEETGKRLFPGASPEAANAAMQILFEEELLVLRDKSGSIYPGVIKTMQALAEEYDLFVVSNSQDGYVQGFMRWSGLTCVRDIEMSGRTGLDKGSNIRLVMERNNITQAVYVGDTQKDAAAAEKAGIPFIFAEYGFGDAPNAALRIGSIEELPQAVAAAFSQN